MTAPRGIGAIDLRRLTLFAKGNLDVRDSLHALRLGGELRWNGINEVVRERWPDTLVRVRHETWTRSDALLEANGNVPAELLAHVVPLEPYSPATQFSTALFDTAADAYVLSVQPDIMTNLVRHGRDDYLFCAYQWPSWPETDVAWLRKEFAPIPVLDAAESMRNLGRIVERLRARTQAPILVYNLSSAVLGDTVHCHQGLGDILSTRIRRFNLALVELSQRSGVSVVDVDAIVARMGASRAKVDSLHLTAQGCEAVAREVVRILEDCDCLAPAEAKQCG